MRVPLRGYLEYVGAHRAQLGADRQAKIGGGQRIVGHLARIAAAHADGQRMRVRDAALARHCGYNRNVQSLSERGKFVPRFGENHAAAGNAALAFGARQQSNGALHVRRERRHASRRGAKKRGSA